MKKQVQLYALLIIALITLQACSNSTSSSKDSTDIIPATVITLAGMGESGFTDGMAANAQFNMPMGIFVAGDGTILISDSFNEAVRALSPSGEVTTLIRGDRSQPRFRRPFAVITDHNGDIIFSDEANHRILRLSGSGELTTVAGTGSRGTNNGPALEAGFYIPFGLAMDASGNILVADAGNNLIRKITPDGQVSTLAGDGTAGFANGAGTSAQFNYPTGIAVGSQGNIYVADSNNNMIRLIDPNGNVSVYAGTGEMGRRDGPAASATFYSPVALAVDSAENVYLTDTENHLIRRITNQGILQTVAGSGEDGYSDGDSASASFLYPQGIAIDPDGNLIVTDYFNHAIRKIIFD